MKPITTRFEGRHVFEKNLTLVGTDKLTFKAKRPRVHLSRASYSFERGALRCIADGQTIDACELLIDGIKHGRYYQNKLGKRPSTRLYDLLAGIAVRNNQTQKLSEMMQIIHAFPVGEQSAFKLRLEKWNDQQSKWYGRWRDTSTKLTWRWTENGTTKPDEAKFVVF